MDLTMNYYFAPMEGITGYVFRKPSRNILAGYIPGFPHFSAPNMTEGFGQEKSVIFCRRITAMSGWCRRF